MAPAARKGLLLQRLLGPILCCWAHGELVDNGDFGPGPSPVDPARSSGTYAHISGADVASFPGTKTTALQMMPDSVVTINGKVEPHSKVGWYKVQFFVYAPATYSASTTSAFSVQVVDAAGAVVSPRTYPIPLRSPRGQWLHYNEWVPCNRVGVSAPRLNIARFDAGQLQITGLSIQHKDFADRGLTPVDLCRCTVPRNGVGRCGNNVAQPLCVPTACPSSAPGECTPGYANSIEAAYDGFHGREDGYLTTIQQDLRQIVTHAIEVDLGGTMKMCGVQLYWDTSDQYARIWRILATDGGDYDLLAEAAPEGSGKEVISGPSAWDADTPEKQRMVAQNDYGLKCINARRVRIEMEDSVSDLFFKLLELRVLTGEGLTCNCQHGGVCIDGGGCTCPEEAHPTCVKPECGWSGTSCTRAACNQGVSCNNYATCTGPNTCTCRIGWHGTVGAEQCITPRCGDGGVTTSELGGSETCDDGNLVSGDGCSAACQLEEFHPQRLSTTQPRSPALYIPREEIYDEIVNERSIASALMNRCVHHSVRCLRNDGGPLELCEVDIGQQCLVDASQIMTYEQVCTRRGSELFPGFEGCTAAGGRQEVKYYFNELSCETICFNGGSCSVLSNECLCQAGWEGSDCSISQCRRGCDHGGNCIGVDDCGACGDGWTGEFCGTAEGFLASFTILFAAVTCLVLAGSIVLTCYRSSWVPIRARGVTNLLGKFIGGIFWICTAVCSIWGEAFAYDVRWGSDMRSPQGTCMVSVNSPWDERWADRADWPRTADGSCTNPISCTRNGELSDQCEGNTTKWQFWYTLVFGFGLWLASNLGYLRSMIQIHISHKLPLAFIALAIFMLAPWILASWVGSPFLALGLAIAYLLYTAMLYAELWPIRTEFLDVKHHAWGCIAAIINVMFQIWIVQGGRVGRRIDWDLDWDYKAVVPATLATVNALVTVCIVAVHFCFTAGHLLYLAVFKANNPHVLAEYYDEYNPDDKDHFKAQMHTFDHQVRTHARSLEDHSLHARIARRRFRGDATVMEEQQQTRIEHYFGWKTCLLFPFTAGLVYFCPIDKREVYVRDGSPVHPLCHHKVHSSIKASYHHAAHNTTVGHHVHKHAYHREQFGTRKKLKPQTLKALGRKTDENAHRYPTIVHENMPAGGWWSAEDGFRNGGCTTGVEDSANTTANKSGGWRAQAAVRAEETRNVRAAAIPEAPQQIGELPPLKPDGIHHHHHHHHHHQHDSEEAVSACHHKKYGQGP